MMYLKGLETQEQSKLKNSRLKERNDKIQGEINGMQTKRIIHIINQKSRLGWKNEIL